MSTINVTYGGVTIRSTSKSEAFSLATSGKYMDGDVVFTEVADPISDVLNDNEWPVISDVAKAGDGGNYWSVGDAKSVSLSGTVGTLSINATRWVYIIGINHRGTNGITFQGFKTGESGVYVGIDDSHYNSYTSSGALWFNMNHWGTTASPYNTSYGGWAGCDLRYDILGSTNIAPSGYGSTPTTSRVGYDAGETTATNPKANTLMSCLPTDLRNVMRPLSVYTDNKGGGTDSASNVSVSIDYLPLLAEFEILGVRDSANSYEQNNQSQYAFYAAGNSTARYRNSATGSAAIWYERSVYTGSTFSFCCIRADGTARFVRSYYSYALAPIFLV